MVLTYIGSKYNSLENVMEFIDVAVKNEYGKLPRNGRFLLILASDDDDEKDLIEITNNIKNKKLR